MTEQFEEKAWGRTRCTLHNPRFTIHELEVEAGGFCSFHYHRRRHNIFYVESGVVKIVWAHGWKLESIIMTSGDCPFKMLSRVAHQFQVIESGKMIEEYCPAERHEFVELEDIDRLTIGGKIALPKQFELLGTKIYGTNNDGSIFKWKGGPEEVRGP